MSRPAADLDAIEAAVARLRGRIDRSAGRADPLATAQKLSEARAARNGCFPAGMFADPAWDLLVEAFLADAADAPFTIRELTERAGIPQSTGHVRVAKLEEMGLLASSPSPERKNARRVRLTKRGSKAMRDALARMGALFDH